jgi:hypothetical protein
MKTRILLLSTILLLNTVFTAVAQETKPYSEVANERAAKIVTGLAISNAAKEKKVQQMIAGQYIALDKIQTATEAKIKNNPALKEEVNEKAAIEVGKLHKSYIAKLSKELDKEQIDEVKNGMTYHTVPKTYANYLLMLPYISKEDETFIWNNLVEARELAMDAGSSKGKHALFNKYKGKIANHLAAKGYDLKKEGNDWASRRNTKDSSLAIKESNRIMSVLNIQDKAKAESVRNLVAYQYQKLEELKKGYGIRIGENKKLQDKDQVSKANEAAWQIYKTSVDRQRDEYFDKLAGFLNKDQIELVKNEMTGNGLHKEYARFQQLLPDMKEDHKAEVYKHLVEARENALNVLTSRERNQWFIKYRGRANNYLSKQGYDLRKATEELEKRQAQN